MKEEEDGGLDEIQDFDDGSRSDTKLMQDESVEYFCGGIWRSEMNQNFGEFVNLK